MTAPVAGCNDEEPGKSFSASTAGPTMSSGVDGANAPICVKRSPQNRVRVVSSNRREHPPHARVKQQRFVGQHEVLTQSEIHGGDVRGELIDVGRDLTHAHVTNGRRCHDFVAVISQAAVLSWTPSGVSFSTSS